MLGSANENVHKAIDVCQSNQEHRTPMASVQGTSEATVWLKPPMTIYSKKAIPRPQIEREVAENFLTKSEEGFTCFRVIIGPYGCGKTYAVRHFCNEQPKGE